MSLSHALFWLNNIPFLNMLQLVYPFTSDGHLGFYFLAIMNNAFTSFRNTYISIFPRSMLRSIYESMVTPSLIFGGTIKHFCH
jgi:hypothetical protein